MTTTIAFIGFGEAARAFTDSLRATAPVAVRAYDILIHGPEAAALAEAARPRGVTLTETAAEAIAGADVVVSAVTAAAASEALVLPYAGRTHPHVLFDINSVTAARKADNAARVRAGGAYYVDMAVMAPVHPAGHRTPVFVAGDTGPATDFLTRHDFCFEDLGPQAGQATAVKMVRSLFVKGLEAITVQCLTAAVASGCGERILASLAKSYPGLGMETLGAYTFERVTTHGKRRSEEVREVAQTMRDLGYPAGAALAEGIADVQAAYAAAGITVGPDALDCARAAVAAFAPLPRAAE